MRSGQVKFMLADVVQANKNGLLARTLAGAPGGGRPAPITEPEKLQEALKTSYGNLQQAIAGLSDADLKAPVKVFGKDFTKEEAVRYILADQHEHLGQSIAYARAKHGPTLQRAGCQVCVPMPNERPRCSEQSAPYGPA